MKAKSFDILLGDYAEGKNMKVAEEMKSQFDTQIDRMYEAYTLQYPTGANGQPEKINSLKKMKK